MYPPRPADTGSPATDGTRSSLSALAVSALVIALVPCCPVTALIGAFLGLLALRRIQRSGGRLRGARLAVAAMIAGVIGSIVWAAAFERLGLAQQEAQEAAIAEQVRVFVVAAQEGRANDAIAMWFPAAATPTATEVLEFGTEVTNRYESVTRFAVLSTARSGPLLSPQIEVAGIYRTAAGSPIGSARFRVIFRGLTPVYRPTQVTIEDPDRGDLVLGGP